MTHEEANDILNPFEGWRPGQKCSRHHVTCRHFDQDTWNEDGTEAFHDIPPFNYFADTPEARERVRLLKDDFVRRDKVGTETRVHTWFEGGRLLYALFFNSEGRAEHPDTIESHAIAFAIAVALKENRK